MKKNLIIAVLFIIIIAIGATMVFGKSNDQTSSKINVDPHEGCTFVGDYLCWVSETGVIVDARDPSAIGMTLNDYIADFQNSLNSGETNQIVE